MVGQTQEWGAGPWMVGRPTHRFAHGFGHNGFAHGIL